MGAHTATIERIGALALLLGPGPWPAEAVLSTGWTPRQLAWAVSQGRLIRPARGWVDVAVPGSAHEHWERRCRAQIVAAPPGTALVDLAAWRIHQQWLPAGADQKVHVAHGSFRPRTSGDTRFHRFHVAQQDLVVVRGFAVTSIERTAVDVARGRPFAQALLALDSAARSIVRRSTGSDRVLRRPGDREPVIEAARSVLAQAVASQEGHRGIAVVRRALALVDPCSESPYESVSRSWLLAAGLPGAELAAPVLGESGRRYYADFLWRPFRVIGEADGWAKYGEGVQARVALKAERGRQRDLEAAGWLVVRWDPSDRPEAVVARVAAALRSRGAAF